MAFFLENGGMYDLPPNGPSGSTVGGYHMPYDPADERYSHYPEGQQSMGENRAQTLATTDGSYSTDHQAPKCAESNVLIVDVVGFQVSKDFFVKELAFYNPTTHMSWLGLFKPPFEKGYLKKKGLKCIDFSTDDLHGLKWNSGDYPYSAVYSTIAHFAQNATLYAKGDEKCQWIQQFTTSPILNLELIGCPPANQLPHECLCLHHNTYIKECALDKAVRLGKYFAQMYNMVPPTPPNTPSDQD